jgi:hypothetical protein
MTQPKFELEASFDDKTGQTVAVYLRVRAGEVAETREVKEGVAFADYDAQGALLGIELLGPCEAEVLEDVATGEPDSVKRFLKGSAPRELVPV